MPTETRTPETPDLLSLRRAILCHPVVTFLVGIAALLLLGAFAYEPAR